MAQPDDNPYETEYEATSEDDEPARGWDGRNERPLCVTLERDVNIPGPNHEPPQTSVFRARERSVDDDVTTFFGLTIGPDNAVVEVSNDNIRSVAVIGDIRS